MLDYATIKAVNPALALHYRSLRRARKAEAKAATIAVTPVSLVIGNCALRSDGDRVRWTAYVRPMADDASIQSVTFDLHPTFAKPTIVIASAPFEINVSHNCVSSAMRAKRAVYSFLLPPSPPPTHLVQRNGWGTFTIGITVLDVHGGSHAFSHELSFDTTAPTERVVTFAPAAAAAVAPVTTPVTSSTHRTWSGISEHLMHGRAAVGLGFEPPNLVTFCEDEARPGYTSMSAHEYSDNPVVLREKVKLLAAMIKRSKRCTAYTGAGISTASGIDDYASKSKASAATGTSAAKSGMRAKKKKGGLDASPTFAHFTLVELFRAGHLRHWVQQNHDGLPQKAGLPQEAINEIHGAWFDPSNPVVPMSGHLRTDLCEDLETHVEHADLVLAMGTSLCGMNADRVVEGAARRCIDDGAGEGSVIVGFQRTAMDNLASLRIYARIDEVMLLLAMEMELPTPGRHVAAPVIPINSRIPGATSGKLCVHKFLVPYDRTTGALLSPAKAAIKANWMVWNLSQGTAIKLTDGPGKGFVGKIRVAPTSRECAYCTEFPSTREGSKQFGRGRCIYAMGDWWIHAACAGTVPSLPVVNV